MSYTVIYANKDQAEALLKKHMLPIAGVIPKIINSSYSYDSEDHIGFVTLTTITGKQISYQLRDEEPCFVEFTGFGNIRYDIGYPEELNIEMYRLLAKYGKNAKNKFWKGGSI
jgi:hypothetical protein